MLSRTLFLFLLLLCGFSQADTMGHYMSIINGLPQMELKADSQSQAWARSARSIIALTCDGIADTLVLANELTKKSGQQPLFCLTKPRQLTPETLDQMIQETYRNLQQAKEEKDKLTVSEVAFLAVQQKFPCSKLADMSRSIPPQTTWNRP